MNAKLPLALGLTAVLVLPVLAHTLTQQRSTQTSPEQSTAANLQGSVLAQGTIAAGEQNSGQLVVSGAAATMAGPLPTRGMTMAQVEQSHGAPNARRAPVGNPPITRWEYSDFVVYFEYRHVIHAVTKRN